MAQIHARLNEVEAWGGEGGALPPGEYHFLIEEAKQAQSKNGKPQLELDLKVLSEGEFKGRSTKQWYTLNFEKDVPRKRLKSLILATGIPLDGNGDFDDSQLKGTTFVGDVQVEQYEAVDQVSGGQKVVKERTRIVNERPAGSVSGVPQPSANPAAAGGFVPNAPAGGFPASPAARGNPLTPVGQQ